MTINPLDEGVKTLGVRNTFRFHERQFDLVCLIYEEDRQPLKAEW